MIPDFVPRRNLIPVEADCDESDDYDDEKVYACSICVPVKGEMHCNDGVLMYADAFRTYTETLGEILCGL